MQPNKAPKFMHLYCRQPTPSRLLFCGRLWGAGVLLIGWLLGGGAGCSSPPQRGIAEGAALSDSIAEIHLLSIPVALNFDQNGAPDGFAVKLFANTQSNPKTVRIASGSVELLMFEGMVAPTEVRLKKPKRIWTYSARQLPSYYFKGSVGVGYQFTPAWEQYQPSGDSITVVARYVDRNGAIIYSAPSIIAVNPQ
jgi:hypothetical protein